MKKNNKRESIIIAVILLVVLAVAFYLDAKLPSYHIAIKVIKNAAVYSLVAVSMNLLNGFTGLFSLGQAGFMLLGAYAYAVLSIPVDKRAGATSNTEDGDFSAPGALKALEEKLTGRLFARCNSGYLVNLAQVSGVQQNTVQVGPHELQISRPKRRAFLAARADYIGGEGA